MKKITLLLCMIAPFMAIAQSTCATAQLVTAGTTVVASVNGTQLPTPDCSGDLEGVTTTVWYKFVATVNGGVTISSHLPANEENDTRLHVYQGACGSLSCIGFSDDVEENYTSEVSFLGAAGTTYYFAWDDYYEDLGFSFSVAEFSLDCATTIPDAENFSATSPLCFTTQDIDGDGNQWVREEVDFDGDDVPETFFTNYYNDENTKNDWLFSPSYALTGGESYTITYTYNALDLFSLANETLEVLFTNAPTSTALFQEQIAMHTGIVQVGDFETIASDAVTQTAEFTPVASGNYNLAFHAMSPEFSSLMFLFNYTVDVSLKTPTFEGNKIKMYPNPVVNELTVVNENPIDSVTVFNLMGQKVVFQEGNANEMKVDLGKLASGTYIVKVASGDAFKTMKISKQ